MLWCDLDVVRLAKKILKACNKDPFFYSEDTRQLAGYVLKWSRPSDQTEREIDRYETLLYRADHKLDKMIAENKKLRHEAEKKWGW